MGQPESAGLFCEDEYRYFLDRLREGQGRFGVALHAYVLMTNHVHLLMTPRDTAGISRLMQHLGRHYVLDQPAIPAHWYAVGRAPQGESRAGGPISPYLYALRYIELNPVAAGMVQSPERHREMAQYAWGFETAAWDAAKMRRTLYWPIALAVVK